MNYLYYPIIETTIGKIFNNINGSPDLIMVTAEKQILKIAILGAGAWGSALAKLASYQAHHISIWSRRLVDGQNITNHNINISEDLATVLADADLVVSAVSMAGVTATAERLQNIGLSEHTVIVTATKGLDLQTSQTPSQIWQKFFPQHSVVVLSGPNLSEEINQGLPAATVVASNDAEACQIVQKVFASSRFRVYTSDDPLGTELGGTLKNVIAIATGVCDGLNLGNNAKSALLTRALTEIIRVGKHLGGKTETFFGLSGLGDMLTTCSSILSRNYRVGYSLAEGKSLEQILQELNGTAEGVNTTNVVINIAKRENILVPIAWQVYQLLNQQITAEQAVLALMERDLKPEFMRDES